VANGSDNGGSVVAWPILHASSVGVNDGYRLHPHQNMNDFYWCYFTLEILFIRIRALGKNVTVVFFLCASSTFALLSVPSL